MTAAVDTGMKAPALTLEATGDQTLSIPPQNGRGLVVFFYPKDNTPGCTTEAKAFSALKDAFDKAGYDIVGISRDGMKAHENFIAKQDLTIPLASDKEGEACEAFGVWKEKNMYGRKFMGIERSTFLIDADGIIQGVWRKVRVKGHAEAVLEQVENTES
ncbi:peroxiredoxin [Henriciella aquimarina]|uniref:peroxiredoxin n=1 Tax=Henriciella aquimarina TaxID=545261 RepID=UPI000A0416B5|nr:peroxiredoxin [Henriciella aquimarina]